MPRPKAGYKNQLQQIADDFNLGAPPHELVNDIMETFSHWIRIGGYSLNPERGKKEILRDRHLTKWAKKSRKKRR